VSAPKNQDRLDLTIKQRGQTETFADKTLAYILKELTFPADKQREAIVIDLLDAIALANVSDGGATDRRKVLHMPLLVALATGNTDALGPIGNSDGRRTVWLALARGSGDATVRRTAMEALARSSASQPLERLLEIYYLSAAASADPRS
jgi:hypothetical protein